MFTERGAIEYLKDCVVQGQYPHPKFKEAWNALGLHEKEFADIFKIPMEEAELFLNNKLEPSAKVYKSLHNIMTKAIVIFTGDYSVNMSDLANIKRKTEEDD